MDENSSAYTAAQYADLKKYVGQGLFSAAEQCDKALLALSGGAFGVSVAFLKDIAPHFDPGTKGWIIYAWVLFLLSIVATLSSFQASACAFREFDLFIDACQQSPDNAPITFKHRWNRITIGLNILSLLFFVAGAICLAVFSYRNLQP